MDEFDYIIIGAGSAGCLLANRLSADSRRRVLLLEAGGRDRHPHIQVPAAFYKLFKTPRDWNYETVPQEHMNGRAMYQPRGKVLGGSSSINAMIYIRGHRADYDHWSDLGNKGWSYEEVLPYFKKFEGNLRLRDDYHGIDGELTVSDHIDRHPISEALLLAAQQAGYPLNKDFNGSRQEGFGFYQLNIRDGKRCSAARAFLEPVKSRSNLKIITKALVHRIRLEDGRASGVVYEWGGRRAATASREVILCAGAFGSPHLLMLSGIGHEKHLKDHGIEVRHHLPGVGLNLQDHLISGISVNSTRPITMDWADRFPHSLRFLWQYLTKRRGPLTSNIAECGGFLKTHHKLDAPDLQFHFAPAYYLRHGFDNPKEGSGYSLGPTLINPSSRGHVRLLSADPHEAPRIDPKYFSNRQDVKTMIKGFHITREILAQPAFDPFRGTFFMPDRELHKDDEVEDYLRNVAETLYHPVGTCKMGTDKQAVVDPQLRVQGVKDLRIADASVMPTIVRGNTNAPAMMIAEKAAALIQKGSL